MASSHDPHRPFGGGKAIRRHEERAESSRIFRPEEVRVPVFLPDFPAVRAELAAYCTSVRRLDDMVGAVLGELERAQLVDNTIVVFLSDHGMPFPSAKFNCYVDSMRSPWIVRWPGKVKKASIDRTHMISTVDLQPTILEAVGLPAIHSSDGRSFMPLLRGESQSNRDCVFTQFNHIHGKDALPMRSVLTRESAYVWKLLELEDANSRTRPTGTPLPIPESRFTRCSLTKRRFVAAGKGLSEAPDGVTLHCSTCSGTVLRPFRSGRILWEDHACIKPRCFLSCVHHPHCCTALRLLGLSATRYRSAE